jgi:DNA-binding transcriptional ArsR family regulator
MVAKQPKNDPLFDPERDVVTEASSLQGLAHPLRLQLLGLLRRYGPSTASKLAATLGVSSGLSSYHLRQLAQAGFVVDAEDGDLDGVQRGGRERWWKAARRTTYVISPPAGDDEAVAATTDYLGAVLQANFDNARRWLAASEQWPPQWHETASFYDMVLSLTPAETRRLQTEIGAVIARYPRQDPDRPGRRNTAAVSFQFQVFPSPGQEAPAPRGRPG